MLFESFISDVDTAKSRAAVRPRTGFLNSSSRPAASPCKSELSFDLSEWIKRECSEERARSENYDCDLDAGELKTEPVDEDQYTEGKGKYTCQHVSLSSYVLPVNMYMICAYVYYLPTYVN